MPDRAFCFAVDRLLSKEDACAGSGSALGSALGVVFVALRENKLASYPDDDDGNYWDFFNVPFDTHVCFRAVFRRDFDAICNIWRLINVAVAKDVTGILYPALQSLNSIAKCGTALAAT